MRRGGLAALEGGRCKLSKAELNIYILLYITKMMAGDTALLLPIKNFLT